MPYIKDAKRFRLDNALDKLPFTDSIDAGINEGELAYIIARVCDCWLQQEFAPDGPSYITFAKLVGILETAKLEIQRRLVEPFEDRKLKENGEVYFA